MSERDTGPPAPETPGGVWPPAPQATPPVADKKQTLRTLTPHAWLDLVLGLPTGLAGAFLLFAPVGILGDLISPPPESGAKMRLEFCVSAPLSAAACVFFVRRVPLFGIALTTGALILLLIASILVWPF